MFAAVYTFLSSDVLFYIFPLPNTESERIQGQVDWTALWRQPPFKPVARSDMPTAFRHH